MSLQSLVLRHSKTSTTTLSATRSKPCEKMNVHKKTKISVKRPRKRVHFANKATLVRRHVEYTADPVECWYQAADYSSFERERRETVAELQRVQYDFAALDMQRFCLRGLEQTLTTRQLVRREQMVKQCKQAVIGQQLFQEFTGIPNPEKIKAASRKHSAQAIKKAVMIAVMERAMAV